MQVTRNDLGKFFNIRLTRNYGPYLNKPPLPAGEYVARLTGWSNGSNSPTGLYIKNYYVMVEDIEFISEAQQNSF